MIFFSTHDKICHFNFLIPPSHPRRSLLSADLVKSAGPECCSLAVHRSVFRLCSVFRPRIKRLAPYDWVNTIRHDSRIRISRAWIIIKIHAYSINQVRVYIDVSLLPQEKSINGAPEQFEDIGFWLIQLSTNKDLYSVIKCRRHFAINYYDSEMTSGKIKFKDCLRSSQNWNLDSFVTFLSLLSPSPITWQMTSLLSNV